MATDLTATVEGLRGLLIQDPRLSFSSYSSALSTVTQAGNLPGVPAPAQDTDLLLESVGSQSASKSLQVRTIHSGNPGTDAGRYVWRYASDALWSGWNPPTTIQDWAFIDRSTVSEYWKFPHAITTTEGKVIAVAERQGRRVYAYTRSTSGSWGAGVEVYDRGSSYTDRASPCLVALPSGRVLCFFWREKGSAASVWLYYSDDDGASWTVGSRAALSSSVSTSTYDLKRLRAGYLDGQIILIAHLVDGGAKEEIHQWASADLGSSFQKVDSLEASATVDYGFPDVIAHNGSLYVAYLKLTSATPAILPYVRRLGSAYETISGAAEILATSSTNAMEWGQASGGLFTEGNLCLWADQDGSLYVAGLDHDAAGGALKELMISRSADGGDTWGTVGSSSAGNGTGAAVWYGRDANTYPTDFCATAALGQTVMIHRFKADPGTADDSLCAMILGGYSTVEMPELSALNLDLENRTSWEITYLPFDEPDSMSWSKATAGSPTVALTANGASITHPGTSDSVNYSVTPTQDKETILFVNLRPTALGPTAFINIRTSNGSNQDVDVDVTCTAAGLLTMTDNNGGTLGSVNAGSVLLSGVQVMLAVSAPGTARASAWYRIPQSTDGIARAWIPIATNQAVTVGTVTSGTVRFGSVAGVAGQLAFSQANATWADYAGVGLSTGQTNPDDLLGRAYMPSRVYVDDGLSLQASDGPTFRNDQWAINSRYQYAVDNVNTDVAPSPRVGWRSTGTTQAELIWELSGTVSDTALLAEDLYGIHLSRINWRTGSLWGRNSSGGWDKLFDIDAAAGSSALKFTRNGSTIQPDPSGGSDGAYWWPLDALEGATWDNGTQARAVSTNTAGAWLTTATAANAKKMRLILDDYATGDVASGADGSIWARDVTVIKPLTGSISATGFSAFKLRIDAQDTATGDFRIGSLLIGPVVVFGGEYSWGRGLSVEMSIDRTEGRGGTRSARQLAPMRRSVEVGWPDGLDTSPVGQTVPAGDYYRATSGGSIIAGEGDALWSLRGMLGLLSRSSGLVAYLGRIPIESSPSTITINHREQHLYGRIMSDTHRVDNVQGEEWRSEVLRGGRFRIDEEL